MSLRELPQAALGGRPKNFHWDAPTDAIAAWADMPLAAAEDAATISILDQIGQDFWTGEGVTAKRIGAALRSVGNSPVTVAINSPGGDMFEGIAIYNMLAAHPAEVTVQVLGIAASAASIIAMAGDTILMGDGAQLMIHNAWGVVVGNQHDMTQAAEAFAGFDASLADIYHARTGAKMAEIKALMDAETFMRADQAVRLGFADGTVQTADGASAKAAIALPADIAARRQIEKSLAMAGHSRADRSRMIAALGRPRDAAAEPTAARDAGELSRNLDGFKAMMLR
jgi:ATP-dependent protease ClpP protease subunit